MMVFWQKISPATGHSVDEEIELHFPEKLHTTQKLEIFNLRV